ERERKQNRRVSGHVTYLGADRRLARFCTKTGFALRFDVREASIVRTCASYGTDVPSAASTLEVGRASAEPPTRDRAWLPRSHPAREAGFAHVGDHRPQLAVCALVLERQPGSVQPASHARKLAIVASQAAFRSEEHTSEL